MKFFLLSCEHGGNTIPNEYRHYFAEAAGVLNSHRGWDPGALNLFNLLKPEFNSTYFSTTSRLLVELNRSLHHTNLFSDYTKSLPKQVHDEIIEKFYSPYRTQVEQTVSEQLRLGKTVFHLSIHSFTPSLDGEERNADIGLLYDPSRKIEKEFSAKFKSLLTQELPDFKVRMNYPYLGTADGLTTYLRKKYTANYCGMEFELNQKWADNQQVYNGIYEATRKLLLAV
jgi:predicted N-formylglutamate amidohydrolase